MSPAGYKFSDMVQDYLALAQVSWISPEDGGRKKIPSAKNIYAATASFDEDHERTFSIVLRPFDTSGDKSRVPFREQPANTFLYEIGFLEPSLVLEKLPLEHKFVVKEGSRKVADGIIIGLEESILQTESRGEQTAQ